MGDNSGDPAHRSELLCLAQSLLGQQLCRYIPVDFQDGRPRSAAIIL